jgi:hypothetical protein
VRATSPVGEQPRSDAAQDEAREIRARAWRFIFECAVRRNAEVTGGEEPMKAGELGCAAQRVREAR